MKSQRDEMIVDLMQAHTQILKDDMICAKQMTPVSTR